MCKHRSDYLSTLLNLIMKNRESLEMDSEEYADILRFLSFQEFPLYILQNDNCKNQSHAKSNFRRLAGQYQVCEGKLFKVTYSFDLYIYR